MSGTKYRYANRTQHSNVSRQRDTLLGWQCTASRKIAAVITVCDFSPPAKLRE